MAQELTVKKIKMLNLSEIYLNLKMKFITFNNGIFVSTHVYLEFLDRLALSNCYPSM
jgi:hypothetical protein